MWDEIPPFYRTQPRKTVFVGCPIGEGPVARADDVHLQLIKKQAVKKQSFFLFIVGSEGEGGTWKWKSIKYMVLYS